MEKRLASPAEAAAFCARTSAVNSVLDALPSDDSESGFSARMSRRRDDFVGTYVLGDPVQVLFNSGTDLYMNIAFVDAQGMLTLIQLDLGSGAGYLKPGEALFRSDFVITHPPLGLERAYYVATRNPVEQIAFNPNVNLGGESKFYKTDDSVKVAENFVAAVLQSNSPDEISTVVIDSLIVGREEVPEYIAFDIVYHYSGRLYSGIPRGFLDSNIWFASNSAILSEKAKWSLDEWGKAFVSPELAEARFEIGGHTDDLGAGEYNQRLSVDRAEAVRRYLTSKFDIAEERFTVAGHGENNPRVENRDAKSRAENRRVEFYLLID